jgi:hypothetical protein
VRDTSEGSATRGWVFSLNEHVGRLGYGARLVQEKLRVAEALERLPAFAEALKQGQICWSALRELTRVATPETETEWLAAGRWAHGSASWKRSCQGLLPAVDLAIRAIRKTSDTCFGSRSAERCWLVFAKRLAGSCVAFVDGARVRAIWTRVRPRAGTARSISLNRNRSAASQFT